MLGLPTTPHVLRWHGTRPGAAHPSWVTDKRCSFMECFCGMGLSEVIIDDMQQDVYGVVRCC